MLKFTAVGRPVPQGSMKAVGRPGYKTNLISDNPALAGWRDIVAWSARTATGKLNLKINGEAAMFPLPKDVALFCGCHFYFERPASTPDKKFPTGKPDVDKLVRAVLDALKGIVWADDAQVTTISAEKLYLGAPGQVYEGVERAEIEVYVSNRAYHNHSLTAAPDESTRISK